MKRVVMITGATRGIGFATAAEFIKNGDYVVIFCRHRERVLIAKKQLVSFEVMRSPSQAFLVRRTLIETLH
jgi:NAD(P)-dependent dehydrogenase (short-subunit alcohol dehydrogenase family)